MSEKPDLVITFCLKCNEFTIMQPNGRVLDDDILVTEVDSIKGHKGKAMKLFLLKGFR